MKRQKKKEETRDLIVRNSRRLFREKGVSETTMVDIARESRISRKTLYQYFKSREEILYQIEKGVFYDYIDLLGDFSHTLTGTGYERLQAYLAFVDEHLDDRWFEVQFTGVFDNYIDSSTLDDENREEFIDLIRKANEILIGILKDGIADGSVTEGTEPIITADTINDSWLCLAQRVFSRKKSLDIVYDYDSRQLITNQLRLFATALKARS